MKSSSGFILLLRSFKYAGQGLALLLRSQRNARIHALASIAVIGAGFWVGISRMEWCVVVLAIAAVWATEGLNTAIEFLADEATKEYHPLIKKAKDAAAAAVLITAIGAAVVGMIIFGPYLFKLLTSTPHP